MEPTLPDTLIVRRLPEALTERDLNELLQFFGAQTVKKEKPKGNQRNSIAIAKFMSHEDASYAMSRLHQLLVLGKRIVVEYADFSILPPTTNLSDPLSHTNNKKWKYPSANETIVKNISEALLTNEDFYHKVLQLMRSMNLSPPFSEASQLVVVQPLEIEEVEMEELYKEDTEESELEADSTLPCEKEVIPNILVRRKKLKQVKKTNQLKMVINPSSIAGNKTKSVTPSVSEVFDKKEISVTKKLEFKITSSASEVPINDGQELQREDHAEGFGKFAPSLTARENDGRTSDQASSEDSQEFITKKKLQIHKLQEEEMKLLSVFKNYTAGNPSSRLYVKNLAKTVKEPDLKHIYGRYVLWTSLEERNMFDIRLMTEGRMKGQAFITLPNLFRAQEALEETNGFMLQGKPLVVQFARSAQSNAANTTV